MAELRKEPIRTVYADGSVVISNVRDPRTNEMTSFTVTTSWYDGTIMNDSKVDQWGIYTKYKPTGEYIRRNLSNWGETYLLVDDVPSLRSLDPYLIHLIKVGYYKGVELRGYHSKGDNRVSIVYYLSNTTFTDDGGSVFAIGDIKLEHFFNGSVNPRHFGAKGNWNSYTLTGNDDTEPFQKAIDYLNRFGTVRKGTPRVIKHSNGNYFIRNLTIPGKDVEGNNVFGLVNDGESRGGVMFSFDDTDTSIGIDCKEEATVWNNIIFNGSRHFPPANAANRKDVMLKFKKWSGHADIDARFNDCFFSNFKSAMTFHGRGLTFGGNCIFGKGDYMVRLMCDTDIQFLSAAEDPTGTQGPRTGYRHYNFNNVRIDGTSVVLNIEGNGIQKDYIHGVTFNGIVALVSDVLIRGINATLRAPVITNCDAHSSFRGGVVQVKRAVNVTDIGNNWISKYDPEVPSAEATDGMLYTYNCDRIDGLTFSSHVQRLNRRFVRLTEGGSDINIIGGRFSELFEYLPEATVFLIDSPTKINGVAIVGNTFSSNGARTNYQMMPANQFPSDNIYIENNTSNFKWSGGDIQKSAVRLYAGATQTTAGMGSSQFQFSLQGNFVVGQVQIAYTPASGDFGSISIDLPIAAVPSNNSLSGSYAGHANLDASFNIPSGTTLPNVQFLNAVTDRIELKKVVGGVTSNLEVADLDATKSNQIFLTFKYRFK